MPKRTIDVLYYTTLEGESYDKGESADLSAEEAARGDSLGAFVESTKPFRGGVNIGDGASVGVNDTSSNPEVSVGSSSGLHSGPQLSPEEEKAALLARLDDLDAAIAKAEINDVEPPQPGDLMTDAEIDALTGDDLDNAVEAEGIDTEKGGSLKDGSLSVDEKRAALKAKRDAE